MIEGCRRQLRYSLGKCGDWIYNNDNVPCFQIFCKYGSKSCEKKEAEK